jgi:hypothetical protein
MFRRSFCAITLGVLALPLSLAACGSAEDPEDSGAEQAIAQALDLGLGDSQSGHRAWRNDRSTLDNAFAALGGQSNLLSLERLSYRTEGERFARGESYFPDDGVLNTHHFEGTVRYDVAQGRSRQDLLRRQATFGTPGQVLALAVKLDGDSGEIEGSESFFGFPGGPLLPDGAGAARRELQLLNPEVLLRQVASGALRTRDIGAVNLGGNDYARILVEDPVRSIRLYVSQRTGLIAALSTLENDPLLRDTTVTAVFQWTHRGGSVSPVPVGAAIRFGEDWVYSEHRSEVRVGETFSEDIFRFNANPIVDPAASRRGALQREFHQGFASLGILRVDGDKSVVTTATVGPGAVLIMGDGYNSLLLERSRGLVLVEAPLNEERSLAIEAVARASFPGKHITDVIVTHHHEDHLGGIRTFIARGARIVIAREASEYIERIAQARSTLIPDTLAARPRPANLLYVEGDGRSLPDATLPIEVRP